MNSFPFFSVLWRISFGVTNLFVWRRGSFIYQFAILRQMDSRKDASQRRYSMLMSRKVQLFRHTLQIYGQRTLRYCCYQLLLSTCESYFSLKNRQIKFLEPYFPQFSADGLQPWGDLQRNHGFTRWISGQPQMSLPSWYVLSQPRSSKCRNHHFWRP